MKKVLSLLIAITVLLAQTAFADTFTVQGTLAGVSTFTTRVFDTPSGADSGTGILGFNAASAGVVSSQQAIEINFNDNNLGNQAINIHLENPGNEEGMPGVTDSSYVVPLMWVVYDDPISDGADNNYAFSGDTTAEAFVVDILNADVYTYGNIAYSVDGQNASLSNFPTDDGAGAARTTSDGQIWVYFGANYTGAPAQDYTSSNLVVELVTLP